MTRATVVVAAFALLLAAGAGSQPVPVVPSPPTPECGSVVVVRCDKPEPPASERSKRDAVRRIEARRSDRAAVELDRVIIEGDAERPESPEQTISRALSRAPLPRGEHSFATGESARCTCMNICPPPPFPCCNCTDRVGSSLANAPGWKPTR
jgi:hypothetical protein